MEIDVCKETDATGHEEEAGGGHEEAGGGHEEAGGSEEEEAGGSGEEADSKVFPSLCSLPKKIVKKLQKNLQNDVKVAYRFFLTKQTTYFKNEIFNIIFLQYVTGLKIVNPNRWRKENDYRIKFTFSQKIDTNVNEQENLRAISKFLQSGSYDKATSIFVETGIGFWLSKQPKQRVPQWCRLVSGLPELSSVKIRFLSNGKISKESERYLYFLTHILLVLFKYGLLVESFLPVELLRVLSILWKHWGELLSTAPLHHMELSFEILLVTKLAIKFHPDIILPQNYQSLLTKTMFLILCPSQIPKKRAFEFHHSLYHAAILGLQLVALRVCLLP